MKKSHIIICLIIGIILIIFSAKLGLLFANINVDGTTEMQFCSYIDNYSASFRLLGLVVVLFPFVCTFVAKNAER